ncbi:uncharacterized protein LOC142989039 [Genypterus blacodes]|uniref:uncharacterized protein LOC142989039 n=1 Tax=Genypterus blacodes TaxID=154954 RepID=UPI003F773340
MASTSITTVGGVVIVTHVLPQDQTSVALQSVGKPSPPSAALAPPPPGPASPSKLSHTTSSKRAELQGLGIVQVAVGLLCVVFSLTSIGSSFLIVHAPLCAGVAFVLSGSLSVALSRRSSVPLVSVTLASSVLSVLLSLMGVAYLCWLLAYRPASQIFCGIRDFDQYRNASEVGRNCVQMVWSLNLVLDGLRGFLLLLVFLQLCVSFATCVLSVKVRGRHASITVSGGDVSPLSASCSDVALLDSVDDDPAAESPPSSP